MDDRVAPGHPAHPRPGRTVVPRIRRPAAPADAAALVAALWRELPPDGWVSGRERRPYGPAEREALAALAARADRLAARGPAAERAAARLLDETARAIADALARAEASAGERDVRVPTVHGGLASPVRLRLARMERWLAGRAGEDPAAGPSADLCLWALEALEADGR